MAAGMSRTTSSCRRRPFKLLGQAHASGGSSPPAAKRVNQVMALAFPPNCRWPGIRVGPSPDRDSEHQASGRWHHRD